MNDLTETRITFVIANQYKLIRTGIRNSLGLKTDILQIGEAENGPQLLNLLERQHPDIVIMDIRLPIQDALDIVPILKRKYPTTKIIILTMYDDPLIINKMLELGVNSYLTADCGSDTIHEAIITCHKTGFYKNNPVLKAKKEKPTDFTEKETRFLHLLADGMQEDKLADALDLSVRTIRAILDKLFRLTNTKTVSELLGYAFKIGLIKRPNI